MINRTAEEAYGQDTGDEIQIDHNCHRSCSPEESRSSENLDLEAENGNSETGDACTPEKLRSKKTLKR